MRGPVLLAIALLAAGCGRAGDAIANKAAVGDATACAAPQPDGDVLLAGGSFTLAALPEEPEEGPPRRVRVEAFSIDRTEVTNAQFREFVNATGYVTLAERIPDPALYPGIPKEQLKPAALVFAGEDAIGSRNPADWWRLVEGANWSRPEGHGSNIAGRERHPVVEVAYEDALAYARWRGRDLPTEAEWEFAARGGLEGARFEWSNDEPQDGKPRANIWQGVFPVNDAGQDGYKARTAPVGCFPSNRFDLYDMTGNVWEWTSDWFADGRLAGDRFREHVIKGGSFLCADSYCLRYRPAARQGGPPDTGSSHIGFRTVSRGKR